MITSGKIKGT